jgi:hypothetical protein
MTRLTSPIRAVLNAQAGAKLLKRSGRISINTVGIKSQAAFKGL